MVERTIVLRVLTRCGNVDQFVSTFRRFSTDSAVFVPTHNQRDVGAETRFSIRLVDGVEVLAGTGEIAERHTTAENVFGKPGILIDIRKLTAESQAVFERLRAPMPSTARVPAHVQVAETNKVAASRAQLADMLRPTAEVPPLFADDPTPECEISSESTQPVEMPIGRAEIATTLGVAPLAPATFVTAPFVNDTPIPRWPRASQPETAAAIVASTAPPIQPLVLLERPERTAMVALDRSSGQPQIGPWQAFCARLAGSIRRRALVAAPPALDAADPLTKAPALSRARGSGSGSGSPRFRGLGHALVALHQDRDQELRDARRTRCARARASCRCPAR